MMRDFAKVLVGRLGQTVVGFLTLYVLLRLMSKADYGLLALITSVAGVIAVVGQFGLTSGLSKLVNDAQVRAPHAVSSLFRRGLWVQCALLVVSTGIGVAVAAAVYADELWSRGPALTGLALFVAGTVASEHYFRTGRTLDHFGEIARLTLWLSIARLVGAVVPYWLTGSIDWSIFWYGGLQMGVAVWYLYRLVMSLDRLEADVVAGSYFGNVSAFEYVRVALPFMVIASSNIIFSQVAVLVLGKAQNLTDVAEYEVANRVVNILRAPAIAFSFVISSRFGRAVASADARAISQQLRINAQVSLLGIPVALGLFVTGDWLLRLLGGSAYGESIVLVRILSIYLAAAFVADSYSLSLDYSGLARQRAAVVVAAALANVALNVWLIPKWGARGAAIAVTTSTCVQALAFMYYIRREFSLGFIEAVRWKNALLALGVLSGMLLLLLGRVPVQGLLWKTIGLGVALAVGGVYALALTKRNEYETTG